MSTEVKIVSLPSIGKVQKNTKDFVRRDPYIEALDSNLEEFDIINIEGGTGVGKTVFLQDFVWLNSKNCISHFVTPGFQYTRTYECILDVLFRQIHFYCQGEVLDDDVRIDDQRFTASSGLLFRKMNPKKPLYFVFDGLDLLSKQEILELVNLFTNLPFQKAKFIFSGKIDSISALFPKVKLNVKTISMLKFGIDETRKYLSDISDSEEEVEEIHKLASRGLPEDLSLIKKACIKLGGVKEFLSQDVRDKNDLLEIQWKAVDQKNSAQKMLIAMVAFNDTNMTISRICEILDFDEDQFTEYVKDLVFLEIVGDQVTFVSETYRKFAQNKLNSLRRDIFSSLIHYYEENPSVDSNRFNLPELYQKIGDWKKVASFFTLDVLIEMINQHESLGGINKRFTQALEASKKIDTSFNPGLLRFALHRCSFKDIEKYEIWESEIEALLYLDEYSKALVLANSVFLKEERLKLLSILAKHNKIKNNVIDPDLDAQIRNLYQEVDFTNIPEKGVEISSILIYTCFDLAIDLVEKLSLEAGTEKSIDYALTMLNIRLSEEKNKTDDSVANFDILNSKIKDDTLKNLNSAISILSDNDNSAAAIIEQCKSIEKFSQKIFLIKSWISSNQTKSDVGLAIGYTLEEIIKASNENVPSASSLVDIAEPLPRIENQEQIMSLVTMFDNLKNINTPTKDYVKLQLILAKSIYSIDKNQPIDRIFDVYINIEELNDLSIKTDCLCLVWKFLKEIKDDGSIESKLTTKSTILDIICDNINTLLSQTAFHYKMVEFPVKVFIKYDKDRVINIISKLNTEERRHHAIMNAALVLINEEEFDNIQFDNVKALFDLLTDHLDRQNVLIDLIDRFTDEKSKCVSKIPKLLEFKTAILGMRNVPNLTYGITKLIGILKQDEETYDTEIKALFSQLYSAWERIDVQWKKIEIGFLIAKDLAVSSRENALQYLKYSTELKESEPFTSDSNVKTYLKSANLCIEAFSGIISRSNDLGEDILKLDEIISFIQSNGERIALWGRVAILLHSKEKRDDFKAIMDNKILPLLQQWTGTYSSYKARIVCDIAPALYLHHQKIFIKDYLPQLTSFEQELAISIISNYLLTRLFKEDINNDFYQLPKLEYTDYTELLDLIELMTDDSGIHHFISHTIKSLKKNRQNITVEQFNATRKGLEKAINTKLPAASGVAHEGYKIICLAELLTLDHYSEKPWNDLVESARQIPNNSDKALVLANIASLMNTKSTKIKMAIIEESFEITRQIPSIFDKSSRLRLTWDKLLEIDRSKFPQYSRIAYNDLLGSNSGGELNAIRNTIDAAQQYDPKFAESLITMLDTDPARQKMKVPIQKRLDDTKKISEAKGDFKSLSTLDPDQYDSVFEKMNADLITGRMVPKSIDETTNVLESTSNMTLSYSVSAFSYFVKNAVKKYSDNPKHLGTMQAIFNAIYENTKLIAILSSANIEKMRALYAYNSESTINAKSPLIRPGQRDYGLSFLKDWIETHIENRLFIIDPYFTEDELSLIKLIQEVNSNCSITVLTSKMSKNNNHINESTGESNNHNVYKTAWERISSDPVDLRIRIVWDKETLKCPFHDRWYISDNSKVGLAVGTSFAGLGGRDSQIVELDPVALQNASQVITTYIHNEDKIVSGYNLKYERFELFND